MRWKLLNLLLLLIPVSAVPAGAESFWNTPSSSCYDLELKRDLIIGSSALGVFIPGYFLKPDAEAGSRGSRDDINFLDRTFMYGDNFSTDSFLEKAGTYGSMSLLLLPALTMIDQRNSFSTFVTYGVMYTEAFLLTSGTKDLLKYGISRYRPYTYEDVGELPEKEIEDSWNSFPSGHTSYAFLGATFLTTTFFTEYPDSPYKLPIACGAYSLAAAVGASRVASGSHFVTDVLAGAAIGSFFGWFVPQMHLKRAESGNESTLNMTAGVNSLYLQLQY